MGRIEEFRVVWAGRFGDAPLHLSCWKLKVGVAGKLADDRLVAINDCPAVTVLQLRESIGARRNNEIAPQEQACTTGGNAHRVDLVGLPSDADVAVDRAALLSEARHVEHGAALLFEVRCHAKKGPNGYDTSPADAGDKNAVGLIEKRQNGLGQRRQSVLAMITGAWLLEPPAMDGDKARAKTFETRVILVTARLIDSPLAPKLSLDRYHRKAIRRSRAIAAALADEVVDHNALGGIGKPPAAPTAALLGGTSLIVDDCGNPCDFP